MSWSDELVAQAKKLWDEGKSAGVVALELGHGITRNAVIGKAFRAGWSQHQQNGAAKVQRVAGDRASVRRLPVRPRNPHNNNPLGWGNTKTKAPPQPKPVKVIAEPPTPPTARMLPLERLTAKSCRWPIGDGPPFLFCGVAEADFPAEPYCRYHRDLAHARQSQRTARALQRLAEGEPLGR
jgi:GcrA cell cycle regulator